MMPGYADIDWFRVESNNKTKHQYEKMILLIACLDDWITVSGQSKDEKAVAEAVEKLRMAMINGDKTALEKWFQTNLSYGHSQWGCRR